MKKIFFNCELYSSTALNAGLLLLRVTFGLSMAFAHGLGKLPPSDQLIGGVTSMGFPMPVVFAWAACLSEFFGGLFLAMGLATRFAGASWVATMGVAAFVVHAADPFKTKELALSYLVVGVFFFFVGGGKYSIDGLINKN